MNESREAQGYIEARLTLRRAEDGGRQRAIKTGYCPNWWIPGRTDRVLASACVELVGDEELGPGTRGLIRIYPFAPELWRDVAVGSHLEISEGLRRTVGEATVTRVVETAMPVRPA